MFRLCDSQSNLSSSPLQGLATKWIYKRLLLFTVKRRSLLYILWPEAEELWMRDVNLRHNNYYYPYWVHAASHWFQKVADWQAVPRLEAVPRNSYSQFDHFRTNSSLFAGWTCPEATWQRWPTNTWISKFVYSCRYATFRKPFYSWLNYRSFRSTILQLSRSPSDGVDDSSSVSPAVIASDKQLLKRLSDKSI